MEQNIFLYLVLGSALFGMTFLPRLLAQHPLTLPSLYVVAGLLLFLAPIDLPPLEIIQDSDDRTFIEYITELLVIISLAGAGLKLDRDFSLANWSVGWRLLGVAMPLTIAAVAFLGWWAFSLAPAAAILLGACLAPTDPVLAEDVQVSPPHEGGENEVRFGLTLEAGLNDALAFPFVYLAIAVAAAGSAGGWFVDWFAIDLLYRCIAGAAVGFFAGKALARYLMHHSDITQQTEKQKTEGSEGLFIISAILLVYSISELLQGYGFLAVFVAAVVGKRSSSEKQNRTIFRFVSQVERLLLAGVLIGFGGMLTAQPEIFASWQIWGVAVAIVLLIRPLSGLISTVGSDICWHHRLALSFFGIRGVGSVYYLAYALRKESFAQAETLWATLAATIVLSLLLHGFTASRAMRQLD